MASPGPVRQSSSPRIQLPASPEPSISSAIARFLLGPITFITFLLSLFLVDIRNVSSRHHIHSSTAHPPSASPYTKLKSCLHDLIYKPNPYGYVRSPEPSQDGGAMRDGKGGRGGKVGKDEPWHWHTKQRHMAKMEISDAFEMRHRVVVALVVAAIGVVLGSVWMIRRILGYFA